MNRVHGGFFCFPPGVLLAALLSFSPMSQSPGQSITFYPNVDSLALWGTCTPGGFCWHPMTDSSGLDRIVIHRYASEFVRGTPPFHIVERYDSAFFTVPDSLHLNRYELWCTSFSEYLPGRWRVPPDSVTFVLAGPFFISLVVFRDSTIIDSSVAKWLSFQTGLGVGDESGASPGNVRLQQNRPNPFNPATIIKFELAKSSSVKLIVYDLLGREVSVLVDERIDAGVHEVRFDGTGLSSGVYLYLLQAGDYVQARTMALIR